MQQYRSICFEFLDIITYDMQLIRKKMVKSAKECIKMQASNSEIYGKMQAVFIEMDTSPAVSVFLVWILWSIFV